MGDRRSRLSFPGNEVHQQAAMADWSALPSGPLELISGKLPFIVDYVRFRSVCTSWRSAVPKRPQLPWLAACRGTRKNIICRFFTFSGSHILPLDLPEFALGKRRCRGSSRGWMALELDRAILLWNPVTGSKIQLPTYAYPCGGGGRDEGKSTHDFLAAKVILSSDPMVEASDCVVLAVGACCGRPAFCRPGGDSWTMMKGPRSMDWSTDVVFYKGRFYISFYCGIFTVNFGEYPKIENIPFAEPPYDEEFKRPSRSESFFVESSGDLFVVFVFYQLDHRVQSKYIGRCGVYKVEWGEQQMKLLKVKSLDDKSFFLGRDCSFSLSASQFPECRGNCIYLEGSGTFQHHFTNIRVCCLGDGSNEFIPNYLDWEPCAWFMPSTLL